MNAPQFYIGETVMVFDDKDQYVQAFILFVYGDTVRCKIIGGPEVERPRTAVYHFSLPQWMAGKEGRN